MKGRAVKGTRPPIKWRDAYISRQQPREKQKRSDFDFHRFTSLSFFCPQSRPRPLLFIHVQHHPSIKS